MFVSLDYDDTYTRDPVTWDKVIKVLRAAGHTVYCVTMRYDVDAEARPVRQALEGKVDGIYFTGRSAKRKYIAAQGIRIDVWVDDAPFWVENDAQS